MSLCAKSPSLTCHSCRPTSGLWQGDSRALALLTPPGEKILLWAAVSFESLPQPTRHSLGALWCVSHGTPDSDYTRAQSADSHRSLKLMSELVAARHSRSAREEALPQGQYAQQDLPVFRLARVRRKFSQLSQEGPSRTPAHHLVRQPPPGVLLKWARQSLLSSCLPLGYPCLTARSFPGSTVTPGRGTHGRLGSAL